jgi:hypothetical protein
MTAATLAHHGALVLALAALAAAGLRAASVLVPDGLQRAIAAIVLAAAAAVAEALALGLVALGGSSVALALAALATWAAAAALLPAPAVGLSGELAAWWRGLRPWHAPALGALAGASAAWGAWLLAHPALGHDMVLYHVPEAVGWVHNGRPGSIIPVVSTLPVGNYPLTHEVLLGWGLGLGRSFVWVTVLTAAMPVLAAVAAWSGLRTLGAPRAAAASGALALVVTPGVIASQSGGASADPAALAWLCCCAALCAGAIERPRLAGPALVAGALAVGTKTTTAPLAVALLVALAFVSRRRLAGMAPQLLAAGLLAVAVGGFWYLRNLVSHGSPFWPFATAGWGDPRPEIIEAADVRFADRPRETLDRLGGYYWDHFGGPLLLLGGALLAPLLARRREVIAASAAAVVSVLIWMNAPFTGVGATPLFDVGTGDATRYLLPGVAAAVVALALAARDGIARRLVPALLAAAVAVGLHNTFELGFPSAPRVWTPVAGAVAGAAAALVLARVRVRLPAVRALGVAALALLALGGAFAADGYTERHGRTGGGEASVSGWFAGQPAWRDGDAPVASTFALIGPLAGDRLQHPLVLADAPDACRRAAAGSGDWIVLDVRENQARGVSGCGRPDYAERDYHAYAPAGAGRTQP